MDLEGIKLSEITQTEQDKYHMIYADSKKMNKQNRNRPTDTENKVMLSKGEAGTGWKKINERVIQWDIQTPLQA